MNNICDQNLWTTVVKKVVYKSFEWMLESNYVSISCEQNLWTPAATKKKLLRIVLNWNCDQRRIGTKLMN